MFSFNMYPTEEYDRLISFFKENGISCSKEHFVKAWKITQAEDYLISALILGKRNGKYVIEGVATTKLLRKFGMCKVLIKKAKAYAKENGGDAIYIMTDIAEPFLKLGFSAIENLDEVSDIYSIDDLNESVSILKTGI